MKQIEVSDELFEKLMDLSKNINEQDHRGTAMPYFFQIQTKELVPAAEGCGEVGWHYDGTILKTKEEINEAVADYKECEVVEIEKLEDDEKEEILEKAGYTKINFEYKDKYENAFLTEKSCKEHIRLNHYHYKQPVDYLSSAFRNPDLEVVYEFLCGLTGKQIHT